eukprot:CAMPEP_0118925162 /NCGR_PEP_ID=MMETSP1169-20130426/3082_1 /TAXON_ID=36882 /ORGANISM="Pyramimonas obovata, Strain CCMP722" /LENGTH=405 /DNA_ID=CAMNT_0006866379 /DNA_START=211 /DNA_END=1428 /DNA_ORIENTATION=+
MEGNKEDKDEQVAVVGKVAETVSAADAGTADTMEGKSRPLTADGMVAYEVTDGIVENVVASSKDVTIPQKREEEGVPPRGAPNKVARSEAGPGGESLPEGETPVEKYRRPTPAIKSSLDLSRFLKSDTCASFVAFIDSLNAAVKGQPLDVDCKISDSVKAIVSLLNRISKWVAEIPPVPQSMRYGNTAFRTFHDRLSEQAEELMEAILPNAEKEAAVELAPYLVESFGNKVRIDYGTGHETAFVAWLYCLCCLGVIGKEDRVAVVTRVFKEYLSLMQKLQTTYWLEPAGSHGVWGLDDYQFMPFLWGSAQLCGHKEIRPKSIHNEGVLEHFSTQYLYLGCVQFVKRVKKGALAETSPMLNDISGVTAWEKVNSGMMKMYKAEVLSKFPIMQHFLFGTLLPFESTY